MPYFGQSLGLGLASGVLSVDDASRLAGHINVKWLGALGDGVTDDTEAIQRALDYAGAEATTVYFPRGLYLVSAPLVVGGANNPVNGPVLRGEVRVGPNSLGAVVGPNPDVATAGGTMLQYTGASGDQAMLDIRNADCGTVENIGFYAANLAKNCIHMKHVSGDTRPVYCWRFVGCAFFEAREYNFYIEGDDSVQPGFGDASGLTFDTCVFWGSYNAHTTSHYKCTTENPLGITFMNCFMRASDVGGGSYYPTNMFDLQCGTVEVFGGGAAIFSGAVFKLRGKASCEFPAFTATGLEFQGSGGGKYIDADDAVGNPAQRSSVVNGGLADNIIGTPGTEMITWGVGGQASLVLNGFNTFGDINVTDALATVVSNGTVLYQFHAGVGPSGGGRASAFTGHTERVSGTWIQGRQDGAGGLDKTHFIVPPTYADNAAAVTGGLVAGDVYKTSAGALLICLG